MSEEARKQFYIQAEGDGFPGDVPVVWFPDDDTDEVMLDGRFTLDHLKRIVAAWEWYNEAIKEDAK